MKVGLFGGSFNPIHQQHLHIARAAREKLNLAQVWFVPVFHPVHKSPDDFLDYKSRRELLRIALKNEPGFFICDAEKELGGLSYTVRTVKHLLDHYPEHEFSLIIGGDSLSDLASWRCIDELVSLVDFIVVERPGFSRISPVSEAVIHWVETEISAISSSQLRQDLRQGKIPSEKDLQRNVLFSIFRHNYYSVGGMVYGKVLDHIQGRLSELPAGLRFHIEHVAKDCFDYALEHGQNLFNAILAGLAHDLFRVSSADEIFSYAQKSHYKLTSVEKKIPMLAHGAASAGYLLAEYPEIDKSVLDAVRYHTSPVENLGWLSRALILSDTLEASRNIEERDKLRQARLPLEEKYIKVLEIKQRLANKKNEMNGSG